MDDLIRKFWIFFPKRKYRNVFVWGISAPVSFRHFPTSFSSRNRNYSLSRLIFLLLVVFGTGFFMLWVIRLRFGG